MTRVTILLTLIGLAILFVAYGYGVHVIHGGSVLEHMYWATAAMFFVALANFIAIAHLAAPAADDPRAAHAVRKKWHRIRRRLG